MFPYRQKLKFEVCVGETEMVQTLLDRGAKVRLPAAICLGRARDIDQLLRRDPDTLKPGGRAAVVVPDNVLFEDGVGRFVPLVQDVLDQVLAVVGIKANRAS